MAKRYKNRRILVFTDPHLPYCHPEAINFLAEQKEIYKPDRVVCCGDLIDGYNASQYLKDPDHPHSALTELGQVCSMMKTLGELFPKLLLVWGNHDARHEVAMKRAGLSSKYLKSVNEIFNIPNGWKIKKEHRLTVDNKWRTRILFKHYSGANSLTEAERCGCCYVQGHAHKKCNIQWTSDGKSLIFGMNVPSLISDIGCPYSYDKLSNQRPVRGCAVIIDGVPHIIPLGKIGWR